MSKITFTLVSIVCCLIVIVTTVPISYAQSTPSFPSCLDPQGTLRASYQNGTHGVAGHHETYSGSDAVYQVSSDTLIQCLCTDEGHGIQSNWWKVDHLSERERSDLTHAGWISVINGYAWGLTSAPYLVRNVSYSCIGGKGGADHAHLGTVFGLAATGTSMSLIITALSGIGSIALSIFLQKNYIHKHT